MAAALRLLVAMPLVGVVFFALVMTVLEVRVLHGRYARQLRWLVVSFAAHTAVLFAVHVLWGRWPGTD